jgi:hypothetical protein
MKSHKCLILLAATLLVAGCAPRGNFSAASAQAPVPERGAIALRERPASTPQSSKEIGRENRLIGKILVADRSLERIDHFRTLGMKGGFGQDQPVCDFIATEKWVSQFGPTIQAGERFSIGKATVVEATDGYGNTGTKLILESAAPKEGLVFYCYAFNARERAYWAIEKPQIQQALAGFFHFAE